MVKGCCSLHEKLQNDDICCELHVIMVKCTDYHKSEWKQRDNKISTQFMKSWKTSNAKEGWFLFETRTGWFAFLVQEKKSFFVPKKVDKKRGYTIKCCLHDFTLLIYQTSVHHWQSSPILNKYDDFDKNIPGTNINTTTLYTLNTVSFLLYKNMRGCNTLKAFFKNCFFF